MNNNCSADPGSGDGTNPNSPVIVMEELEEEETDYADENIMLATRPVPIKYIYLAYLTYDPNYKVISNIQMDPIRVSNYVATYSDKYGRNVRRSLTLFDRTADHSLPGGPEVMASWSCQNHAVYLYDDSSVYTRQWLVFKYRVFVYHD